MPNTIENQIAYCVFVYCSSERSRRIALWRENSETYSLFAEFARKHRFLG